MGLFWIGFAFYCLEFRVFCTYFVFCVIPGENYVGFGYEILNYITSPGDVFLGLDVRAGAGVSEPTDSGWQKPE